MAKQGMKRPSEKELTGKNGEKISNKPKNEVAPVPEIQGKAKQSGEKAKPQR